MAAGQRDGCLGGGELERRAASSDWPPHEEDYLFINVSIWTFAVQVAVVALCVFSLLLSSTPSQFCLHLKSYEIPHEDKWRLG